MGDLGLERIRVGQDLHAAETMIHWGRSAIKDLVQCEPIDESAVAVHRGWMQDARITRNALRHELEAIKRQQNSWSVIGWAAGCADG